ncbi:hypothetical protein [Paenibacillus aestuarii]|uniref:Uncharacterized protein n=1 Tax=Paenibacillus aestuarii TaxID=516965 RepID=A0ABW0KGW5_9BACL|nr:hypothetical protein [Paenibacillus aestuarii]
MKRPRSIKKFVCTLLMSVSLITTLTIPLSPELVSASTNSIDDANPNERSLDKNMRFRKEMGLNVNEAYVNSLLKDKSQTSGKKYGVVLTQEEKSLDERIQTQQEKIPRVKEYIRSLKDDSFAGMYIDQSKGGVINIGYKKDLKLLQQVEAKIKSVYGNSELIQFYKAAYTEANCTPFVRHD